MIFLSILCFFLGSLLLIFPSSPVIRGMVQRRVTHWVFQPEAQALKLR